MIKKDAAVPNIDSVFCNKKPHSVVDISSLFIQHMVFCAAVYPPPAHSPNSGKMRGDLFNSTDIMVLFGC